MMRILVFIVLKVLEIIILVFVPYFVGRKLEVLLGEYVLNSFVSWIKGVVSIVTLFLALMCAFIFFSEVIPFLFSWFIQTNWNLVDLIIK